MSLLLMVELLVEKFQTVDVANSTTEVEYIATSEATKEAIWMKKFITDLDVILKIENLIPLYYDNTGAVA